MFSLLFPPCNCNVSSDYEGKQIFFFPYKTCCAYQAESSAHKHANFLGKGKLLHLTLLGNVNSCVINCKRFHDWSQFKVSVLYFNKSEFIVLLVFHWFKFELFWNISRLLMQIFCMKVLLFTRREGDIYLGLYLGFAYLLLLISTTTTVVWYHLAENWISTVCWSGTWMHKAIFHCLYDQRK